MTQMGTASLDGHVENGTTTMDVVKRAADEYNKIGEVAAKAGMQQFLHDERFEMSKVDGRLVYEVLLELLDPKLVKMQFQMSAMRAVGDPVMYFNKYPGRFLSMHLQGVDLNPPPRHPARADAARGGPRPAARGWQGQSRLAEDLRRRQDRRREKLLHRAELGSHRPERRLSEVSYLMQRRTGFSRPAPMR